MSHDLSKVFISGNLCSNNLNCAPLTLSWTLVKNSNFQGTQGQRVDFGALGKIDCQKVN